MWLVALLLFIRVHLLGSFQILSEICIFFNRYMMMRMTWRLSHFQKALCKATSNSTCVVYICTCTIMASSLLRCLCIFVSLSRCVMIMKVLSCCLADLSRCVMILVPL